MRMLFVQFLLIVVPFRSIYTYMYICIDDVLTQSIASSRNDLHQNDDNKRLGSFVPKKKKKFFLFILPVCEAVFGVT